MKAWGIAIGIVVVLVILGSPVLAISKSDLISFYKGQSAPVTVTPTSTPTPQIPSPDVTPIPTEPAHPFEIPPDYVGSISITSAPTGASVYLDGILKGTTPLTIDGVLAGYEPPCNLSEPPYYCIGYSGGHEIKFIKTGYQEYVTGVIVKKGETVSLSVRLSPAGDYTKYPYPNNSDSYTDRYPYKETLLPDKIAEYIAQKGNRFIWESSDLDVVFFNDIPVAKPNIYLYSDRDLTAHVQLAPEEDITISEPVYQPGKGWLAYVRDGSLNGKGDFLFYEGMVPDYRWQKKEGYVIRSEYRGQDMASMLGQYNFNEKETVEFTDYWSQHLAEGVDYVFYPQETGAVDRVMPLSISPEPDHVMRIWFYAEPLVSVPVLVKNPEKIVREGFYVVEWGVMIR